MPGRRTVPALSVALALVLAACSGPAAAPAPATTSSPSAVTPGVALAVTAERPSVVAATPQAPTASPPPTWCRARDLTAVYQGSDTTTVDPAFDVIERYRLTNRSSTSCRAGAWVGVTMRGVSGCVPSVATTPRVTTTRVTTTRVTATRVTTTRVTATRVTTTRATTTTAGRTTPAQGVRVPTATAPASTSSCAPLTTIRGLVVRTSAWPAHDVDLQPGAGTVLSLLFADTYAPQSCPAVWQPPDTLELRPSGDLAAIVVPALVYPCAGELFVAPLGFGL